VQIVSLGHHAHQRLAGLCARLPPWHTVPSSLGGLHNPTGSAYANGAWDTTFDTCGNKAGLTSLTLRFLGENVNDLGSLHSALPADPAGVQKQPDDHLTITSPGPGRMSCPLHRAAWHPSFSCGRLNHPESSSDLLSIADLHTDHSSMHTSDSTRHPHTLSQGKHSRWRLPV
jgi:hypothetical protein